MLRRAEQSPDPLPVIWTSSQVCMGLFPHKHCHMSVHMNERATEQALPLTMTLSKTAVFPHLNCEENVLPGRGASEVNCGCCVFWWALRQEEQANVIAAQEFAENLMDADHWMFLDAEGTVVEASSESSPLSLLLKWI